MKEWFTARELAGLPGMPKHPQHVAAKLANVSSRKRAGRGGPREWHITAFPLETQIALIKAGYTDAQPHLATGQQIFSRGNSTLTSIKSPEEPNGQRVDDRQRNHRNAPAKAHQKARSGGHIDLARGADADIDGHRHVHENVERLGGQLPALGNSAPGERRSGGEGRARNDSPYKRGAFAGAALDAGCHRNLTDAEIATLAAYYEAKTDKQKNKARADLEVVTAYHDAVDAGTSKGAAKKAICSRFGIPAGTLYNWLKEVKGWPRHVWLYRLVDRNHGRTTEVGMSVAAWETLKRDWLRREGPSMAACIARLRRMAPLHNWIIPSDRTLQRRLEKKVPRAVKVYEREGAKAAAKLSPDQQRDKTVLGALQIINGDGYMHNVWVEFPDGEVRRAKTWFWQDVYSAKILAWRTDKTEHTDVIRLSFGDVVDRFGIPDGVLVDNTRAAANKTMSGGVRHRYRFKVRDEEPLGVFALLGVHNGWAQPEHGQSKPIERAFGIGGIGEYVDKAPDFAGAWTGGSPLDKPDYDGKTRAVPLVDLQRVIEREVAEFNTRAGRRSPINQGRSHDEVFNESFKVAQIKKATEAQRRLWLLATEPVRAHSKDGAITLDAGRIVRSKIAPTYANRYWAPAMIELAGKMVVARFDPQRLHEGVHIYTGDGRYVCFAACHAPAGFNDANAGREHNRARRSFVRATKQLAASEVRMDILEVAKALPGVTNPPQATSGVVIAAPKVIRPEFRPKYEIPQRSEAENAEMAAFEAEATAPSSRPLELLDDHQRYSLWKQLQARVSAGEELEERMAAFYAGFADTARLFDEINTDLRGQAGSNAA